MNITHQTQPTPYACVHTCLAMLTNTPVAQMLERFPTHGMDLRETFIALEALGLQWNALVFGRLVFPGLYLVSTPSLNIEAGAHCVLIDTRGLKTVVYDPNKGRAGKRYYVGDVTEFGPLAVLLKSWSETIFIATS